MARVTRSGENLMMTRTNAVVALALHHTYLSTGMQARHYGHRETRNEILKRVNESKLIGGDDVLQMTQ